MGKSFWRFKGKLALHRVVTNLGRGSETTRMQQPRRYRVTGAGARQRLPPFLANLPGFHEDSEDPKVFCIAKAALRASHELL
jgi:hypothetical protein